MSYEEAFEAAGAVIHDSKWFGSYQGDALFDITYKGTRGILVVSYGSCGGCDGFESTFGYGDTGRCREHQYTYAGEDGQDTCGECVQAQARHQAKLVAFGERYLDGIVTRAKAREAFVEDSSWDTDATKVVAWIDALPPE